MNKGLSSTLTHALAASIFAIMPLHQALSAPGPLPSVPLFLSNSVEPNIFFTLDDSGSMDWGPMITDNTAGLASNAGLPVGPNSIRYAYYHPTWSTIYSSWPAWLNALPPSNGTNTEWDKYWVVRNHHGNKNYYNPDIVYKPWAGLHADGSAMYSDANPKKAMRDPNVTDGQETDLTKRFDYRHDGSTTTYTDALYLPTYFIWDDTDGDGVIEQSDGRIMVEIAANTAEMQNFANWFVYYRSRINATKSAIGRVINNTGMTRMGFSAFNQGHQKDLLSMSNGNFKPDLLDSFYDIVIAAQGTPSRKALKTTGQMFEDTNGGAILTETEGGACQQNFNVLMSDGFWNGASPNIGNTDDNGPGLYDGNAAESNDGGNYADGSSDTLADVAMHYYETDLRTDLPDKVPTIAGVDMANHQHLVNFTIGFGLEGTLDPRQDNPLDSNFSWPEPDTDATRVDDLWHTAYNSRGEILSARNPEELYNSLQEIIGNIAHRTASAAAISVNSAKLNTDSVVYLGQFNTNGWHGELSAFKIVDPDTGALATSSSWDASDRLTQRDLSARPRTIVTFGEVNTGDVRGMPFRWDDISGKMKKDLETNAEGNRESDAVGEARLGYIRGDRSNEGSGYNFRQRESRLGDLINSSPVFVGKPSLRWPDRTPFPTGMDAYSKFKHDNADRQQIVYVGANDGMLHAFDADTGDEEFAYIPGILFSDKLGKGLHDLTDPGYLHNYYVDLSPSVSDVYISSGSDDAWLSLLIGGLRAGGRGIFALDITDPGNFSETNAADMVLWEFTNKDDDDLGFTYSRPFIGLTNAGVWVAIFGNGYNNTGSGESALFIVDIEQGIDGSWDTGDYIKILTGAGSAGNPNGMATPALADLDGNGTVDRVFAGDLLGNMWAFDLSSPNPADWKSAYGTDAAPLPLFTATDPGGLPTPITAKPILTHHPLQTVNVTNWPNIMVYFGSGQFLAEADKFSTRVNSFYGVWDEGQGDLTSTDLIEQTWDTSYSGRVLTRNPVNYLVDHGWHFKLPDTGERSITAPGARATTIYFNSFAPRDEACEPGGYSYRYTVDMITGGSPLQPITDANGDGVIDDNDYVNNGTTDGTLAAIREEGYLPEPVFIEDLLFNGSAASKIESLINISAGQLSWQELIQ